MGYQSMLSVIISDSCLQGLKRGIMEHCHLVVVNKADGELKEAAMRMQYEYTSSLKFMRPISPNWRTKVSALCHQPRSTLTYLERFSECRHKQRKDCQSCGRQ